MKFFVDQRSMYMSFNAHRTEIYRDYLDKKFLNSL